MTSGSSNLAAQGLRLRPIEGRDDAAVAHIIRSVMPEFGAGGAGFAIHDAEVGAMCAAYTRPGAAYFVVEEIASGRVLGGGGVAPLDGGEEGVCELRKMYFLTELRGRGAGKALLSTCVEAARQLGFRQIYIETLTGMDAAQALYLRAGFQRIPGPLGRTGHFSCDRYYALHLDGVGQAR